MRRTLMLAWLTDFAVTLLAVAAATTLPTHGAARPAHGATWAAQYVSRPCFLGRMPVLGADGIRRRGMPVLQPDSSVDYRMFVLRVPVCEPSATLR